MRVRWPGRSVRPTVGDGGRTPDPAREPLREEHRRLSGLVAEHTWDLGGLVYEMALRDHFRVDVLVRRAAELQRLDAELSETERLLADGAGIAGQCRFCGAVHGRSAGFCWSCGERLLGERVSAPAVDAGSGAPIA